MAKSHPQTVNRLPFLLCIAFGSAPHLTPNGPALSSANKPITRIAKRCRAEGASEEGDMSTAAQQFLEMVCALGRAREMNLPPNMVVLIKRCPRCESLTDHIVDEFQGVDGGTWEEATCTQCEISARYKVQ